MAKEKVKSILTKAEKYLRNGKIGAAINEYQKIIKKFPDNLKIRKILGDLYYKEGNSVEAIRHFKWIAEYFLREGDVNKATAMYKRITRISPDYEDAYFKLSELYSRQGLTVEAKQIYLDLADKFKRQKKIKKSLDMYQKVLKYDPTNTEMRLVLAKYYLNQGHEDHAIKEYRTAVDQLVGKGDYTKAQQILSSLRDKVSSQAFKSQINQQLIQLLRKQGKNSETIKFIEGERKKGTIGDDINILRNLGELYLKDGNIEEAEKIFIKIAKLDPEETENLMELSKVYLERGEFKKTLEIFTPIITKFEKEDKFEEASSLLRLIIAYNNTFLPALLRLASLYEKSGKKNNLIAINESLLRVYKKEGMKKKYKETLEKLVELSDEPYSYEEKLAEISGEEEKKVAKKELLEEEERKNEFIHFNLRLADEAINESEYEKALRILEKAKNAYPDNIEIVKRVFLVHGNLNDEENKLLEGKLLLDLYKKAGKKEDYEELLDQLSQIEPDDEKLVDLQKNESTHIDINFDTEDLEVDLHKEKPELPEEEDEEELLVLSEEVKEESSTQDSSQKEVEFEIDSSYDSKDGKFEEEPVEEDLAKDGLEITSVDKDSDLLQKRADSKFDIEVNFDYLDDHKIKLDKDRVKEIDKDELKVDLSDSKRIDKEEIDRRVNEAIFGKAKEDEFEDHQGDIISDIQNEVETGTSDDIEKEKSQEEMFIDNSPLMENPNDIIELDEQLEPEAEKESKAEGDEEFDIEVDFSLDEGEGTAQPETEEMELAEEEPPAEKPVEEEIIDNSEEAAVDEFFDEMEVNEKLLIGFETDADLGGKDNESPFGDIEQDIFDLEEASSEEILEDEVNFFDEEMYYNLKKNAKEEITSIQDWLKELQKQKTSTVEKNMMEIFEEFKKGVNEKIGNEDFDTRYNLGIAYKEMGLIEEAIHEFLISSKSDEKFFDSAGLLGICFREKGMHSEALAWFNKALNFDGRKKDEYLSIKYEMLQIFVSKDDKSAAINIAKEILDQNPEFRDVKKIIEKYGDSV